MIRTATFDDLDALVDLSRLYHEEAHAWLAFDPGYVWEQFRVRTIDTFEGITRVIDVGQGPVGYLAACTSMFFAAPVKIGVELAWFVKPDARGHGADLIGDFEEWARLKGCAGCSLAMNEFPDPKRSEAMARLYRSRGYDPYERGFLKVFR